MHTYAHHVIEESVNQASISHRSQADSDIEYETATNSSCPGKGQSQTRLFYTREKLSYSLSHQPSVPVWLACCIGKRKFIRDTAAIATDCTNSSPLIGRLVRMILRGSRSLQRAQPHGGGHEITKNFARVGPLLQDRRMNIELE